MLSLIKSIVPRIFRSKWGRGEWKLAYADDDGTVHSVKKLTQDDAISLGFDPELRDCTYYARCDHDLFIFEKSDGIVSCLECIALADGRE